MIREEHVGALPPARLVVVDGTATHRALTVVDEQMQDVAIYEVKLSSAEAVREAIQEQGDDTVALRMRTLIKFMMSKVFEGPSLAKPNDGEEDRRTAQELAWFTTSDARVYETRSRYWHCASALVPSRTPLVLSKLRDQKSRMSDPSGLISLDGASLKTSPPGSNSMVFPDWMN
jgi:hypothetical protein